MWLKSRPELQSTVYQKSVRLFIFWITLPKTNRLEWFLVCEIVRKFSIKSLWTCTPSLSAVATLSWKMQKVIFNNTTNTYCLLFALSPNKTNCNCYNADLLFSYCRLLHPVIYMALFYGQFCIEYQSAIRGVAAAACWDMGWISAELGGRCDWSMAKKNGSVCPCCDIACLTFNSQHRLSQPIVFTPSMPHKSTNIWRKTIYL